MSFLPFLVSLLMLFSADIPVNEITPPTRQLEGPGAATYVHEAVCPYDFAEAEDGYWLFEPDQPRPKEAPVVVFMHGYGAYNPMVYGGWIRHLVRKGNTVIYPRYQENLFSPRPEVFAANAAVAIRNALKKLKEADFVDAADRPLIMVGHSYGGTITAQLAVEFEKYAIPQPKGIFLCAPGTGPLLGGRLESYEAMPADTKMLIMVSHNDHIVGDEFAKLVFETAKNTPERNLLRHYTDDHGEPAIETYHNGPYALDYSLDMGLYNLTTWRAKKVSKLDAADWYGYWKLLDGLMNCTWAGTDCAYAFGDTPQQKNLGQWSDGTPVRPLKVTLPTSPSVASSEED
ncbi:MAG: alpha/beta hydrolase [Bacteroidota bacterium]